MDIANLSIAAGSLLFGILAYLVGRRALRPSRRQIRTSWTGPVPVVPLQASTTGLLEVRAGGQALAAPHITTIRVALQGTHDIGALDFEHGKPMSFDLGVAPIILSVEPPSVPSAATSQALELGPFLFRTGSSVQVSFVSDGLPTQGAPSVPVVNVTHVDHATDAARASKISDRIVGVSLFTCLAIVVGCGIVGFLVDPAGRASGQLHAPYTTLLFSAFIFPFVGLALAQLVHRRAQL